MCRLCGLNCRARPSRVYLPMRGPSWKSTPSVNAPATPWTTPEAIESWNPNRSVSQPPALQPQAASRIQTTEPSRHASTRYADSRARSISPGHDRRRRPAEEQERQEEDQVDVVGEIRPERVAPRDPALAGDRGEVTAVRPDRQAGLVAVVDPPAEVVEGRRDDRDREDVLHRRRHHVLAAGDAGLVGHEADVDQPHDDDRVVVELLAED